MQMPGRKLLIVDDDPNEVLFLRNAFDGTASPIDIRHAESGEAALAEIPVFHPDTAAAASCR
jgi:CheY-like chemotaxis protein